LKEVKNKIKRMKPLVTTRKIERDIEAMRLQELRNEKTQAMKELKRYESLYIAGIDKINTERQSPNRTQLKALEDSVDHCKSKWYDQIRKLREIEIQEKSQIAQLVTAETGLKSMEKLQEKYQENLATLQRSSEQKETDETAIRMHQNKRF